MSRRPRRAPAADSRLFPEGRLSGPMPWVIAIMMFLTVLSAAAGIALAAGAQRIEGQVGNRVTVQIVEANAEARAAQAQAALRVLQSNTAVDTSRLVPQAEVDALLAPWLGGGASDAEMPIPAMIDVDLADGGRDRLPELRAAVVQVAPAAMVSDVAEWLTPLAGLMTSLQWLALGLVALMIVATGATVVLAARASLNTHGMTIEILHFMGATDGQIARLFQRRIALDVLSGGVLGFVFAVLVLILIGGRVAAIGSELLGSVSMPAFGWAVLAALPVAGAVLALLVARITIVRALQKLL